MREQYMRTGAGFLLVYSIESRASFEKINMFHRQILRVKDKVFVPVVVVGNKLDLEPIRKVGKNGSFVSSSSSLFSDSFLTSETIEGGDLARHFGCKFLETSAKNCINIDEAFTGLVREIRRHNQVIITVESNLQA